MLLTDYGKLHVSSASYTTLRPRSIDEAVQGWREALERGGGLRVRGSGHGLAGATLPRAGETLVRTRGLDHYRVEAPATITVGSGAVLWDVRDFAAGYGYRLPVYNGGWAGPSVGGFVCAGGMGLRVPPEERGGYAEPSPGTAPAPVSISERYGGFWAHVARITIIDGCGRMHEVVSCDADFPWLFASMGQLGLILEVTLRLLPEPGAASGLPADGGRIPVSNPVEPGETDSLPPAGGVDWRYWFSALVPVGEEDAAWQVIGAWCRSHSGVLRPVGGWVGPVEDVAPIGFRYLVRRKAPTPPLLYPRDEDFVLMGVMAQCVGVGTDTGEARLAQAERAFVAGVLDRGWSLYPQAENLTRSIDFERYWGRERWSRFCALKDRFDPDGRVNPGEVRPAACAPPATAKRMRRVAAAMRRALDLA